jgi:uncharacterized protein YndB with AHSA1/START domain
VKIVLIIVLVLLSIVVAVVLVGLALPANHVAKTRATIAAPPDEVWSVITGVDSFPSWRSDVKTVEVLPPENGKPAWREDGSNGKISYAQTEALRPSHLQIRLTDESLPFGGTWTYEIAPADGSELTITENGIVRNPVFRFVSRFIFGHYKTQESYLMDLGRKFNQTVTVTRLTQ